MAKARTKAPSKGLGDTIEKITEATGIKAAVEVFNKLTGTDCGCEERKAKLNNLIPYRRKVNCLNEADYNMLTEFIKPTKGSLTPNEQWTIMAIYERVFEVKIEHSNCGSCWRDRIAELKQVYEAQNA